jgi:hypothetical protein
MKLFKILPFFLCLFIGVYWFLSSENYSRIVTVTSFNSIPELMLPPLKDSHKFLYIFDVDETLITYEDLLLREANRESSEGKKLQAYFNKNCKKPNDAEYGQYIWSQLFLQASKILIEPDIKNIISRLQKDGFFVIALTHLLTGKYGIITSLQEWRYSQLASFGIDFSKSSPLDNIIFKEIQSKKSKAPMLFKGILLTDRCSKQETLHAFLNGFKSAKGFLPKKIIYVDDMLSYLEDIQVLCKSLRIDFIGYHYVGSKFLPGEFNIELAKKQINHLLSHESWLSDSKTRELLKKY